MTALEVAQRQVSRFLSRISTGQWKTIPPGHPRPLKELTIAAYPRLKIVFKRIAGLTDIAIGEELRHRFKYRGFTDRSNEVLMGRIVAFDDCCVIFTNPEFGEPTERFTLAHEIGHLELEIAPYIAPGQETLFKSEAERLLTMARDTRGMVPSDDDTEVPRKLDKREVFANYFAAELLMPTEDVRTLVAGVEDKDHKRQLVMSRFRVSRKASSLRLIKLGLLDESDPALALFP